MVVGKLYGAATNNDKVRLATGPSRLTVRDSFLNPESATKLESYLGRHTYTELKTENSLDRVTSEAIPRPIELVPAGSLFGFNFVIDIYEPADRLLLKEVLAAMHLLENSSLGGSGSRGHGQVCFNNFELQWKSVDNYRTGSSSTQVPIPAAIVNAIEEFDKLQWPI
jgi:CRISPR-associated protein Csm3